MASDEKAAAAPQTATSSADPSSSNLVFPSSMLSPKEELSQTADGEQPKAVAGKQQPQIQEEKISSTSHPPELPPNFSLLAPVRLPVSSTSTEVLDMCKSSKILIFHITKFRQKTSFQAGWIQANIWWKCSSPETASASDPESGQRQTVVENARCACWKSKGCNGTGVATVLLQPTNCAHPWLDNGTENWFESILNENLDSNCRRSWGFNWPFHSKLNWFFRWKYALNTKCHPTMWTLTRWAIRLGPL